MAAATSCTHTGWKRACAPASGTNGANACSVANRFVKWSCSPKMTEGRRIVRSRFAAFSAASPAALERR